MKKCKLCNTEAELNEHDTCAKCDKEMYEASEKVIQDAKNENNSNEGNQDVKHGDNDSNSNNDNSHSDNGNNDPIIKTFLEQDPKNLQNTIDERTKSAKYQTKQAEKQNDKTEDTTEDKGGFFSSIVLFAVLLSAVAFIAKWWNNRGIETTEPKPTEQLTESREQNNEQQQNSLTEYERM